MFIAHTAVAVVLTFFQYITGRFFGRYRTTIGADFITKTLPHPNNPEESVTLQIWVIILTSFSEISVRLTRFVYMTGYRRARALL